MKAALPWAAAALALAGAVLNILRSPAGFAFWTISNGYLVAHNLRAGERAQASLFTAYLGLSIWGLWSWL